MHPSSPIYPFLHNRNLLLTPPPHVKEHFPYPDQGFHDTEGYIITNDEKIKKNKLCSRWSI